MTDIACLPEPLCQRVCSALDMRTLLTLCRVSRDMKQAAQTVRAAYRLSQSITPRAVSAHKAFSPLKFDEPCACAVPGMRRDGAEAPEADRRPRTSLWRHQPSRAVRPRTERRGMFTEPLAQTDILGEP